MRYVVGTVNPHTSHISYVIRVTPKRQNIVFGGTFAKAPSFTLAEAQSIVERHPNGTFYYAVGDNTL